MKQQKKLGMFGFGCVGQGFYDILKQSKHYQAELKSIGIKNAKKQRKTDFQHFTTQQNVILNDNEIDVLIEVINDSAAALDIVKSGLKNGVPVVSANKKMIAHHFEELYDLQYEYQTPFLYDAAVCGAIPIIRNIEEYYKNDKIKSIETICNGTTNYILTKTIQENKSYETVLKEAQDLGFAEIDPKLDVQAYDPKFKVIILTAHAFGIVLKPSEVWNYGIHHLQPQDIEFAKSNGYSIKLIAKAQKNHHNLQVYVAPHFITPDHPLYYVNNENNAVAIDTVFANQQVLFGKGAGSHPTGASVFSDVTALDHNYRYNYHNIVHKNGLKYSTNGNLKIYCRFDDIENVQDLEFQHIEHQAQNYLIGHISIQQLLEADLNNRQGIFVAIIP